MELFPKHVNIFGILLLTLWVLFLTSWSTAQHQQVSWTPIYVDTRNRLDLWTISEKGCECPGNKTSTDCACCVQPGGCICSYNRNKCAQCGLEESCQRFCNTTINSRNVAAKSGFSWVQIKSPVLEGPTSCWWHLESAPGQRIEVQVHRLIALGSFDNTTQKCSLGFLQFADGDISAPTSQAIQLCAENSRFSPPVVVFGDQGIATLLLRIDGKSRGSQLLAYVSFSSADDPAVGDPTKGGRLRSHTVCDWNYESCWDQECILASPGYPGLFPPHRKCRYFLSGNSSTEKIRIKFHSVNFPKPGLCSSHHISIWKRNSSNYNNLGAPMKMLCHETESTFEVNGSQALIEFRSGATVPHYMYNGFRASVQFIASSNSHQLSTPAPFQYPTFQIQTTKVPITPPVDKVIPEINSSLRNFGDAEEPLLGNERVAYESEGVSTVGCNHIFDGTQTRGNVFRLLIPKDLTIRPHSMSFGNYNSPKTKLPPPGPFKCQLEFRGKPSDIVQFAIFSFRFRGPNCSTIMEVYDMEEERTDRMLGKLCGPHGNELKIFTSSHRIMALVIQVSRFPLNEDPPFTEFLEGAFRFHDESIEGTVKPMASCEVVYYGVTSSPIGTLFGPPDSPLLRLSTYPLVCAHSFIPGPNQSVALTLNRAGHESIVVAVPNSPKYCRSICGSSGCRCEAKYSPLDQIDHMLLMAGTIPIGCLCGYFRDILPMVFESHAPLTLVYHASQGGREFTYAVAFQFKDKVTCANFTIQPPNASKRWKDILGPDIMSKKFSQHYTYFQCAWAVFIPSRYKLTLDFISEEEEEDCNTWNLTLWSGHALRQDLQQNKELFSFCPNQGRGEIEVPDTIENAFIKLAGVTLRPPQFEVRWKYFDVVLGTGLIAEKKMTTSNANVYYQSNHSYVPFIIVVLISLFSNPLDPTNSFHHRLECLLGLIFCL